MVKEKQGVTFHERRPALTTPRGDLGVTSQEKANFLARVFSEKIRTPEPDRQPPPLPRLGVSTMESMVITEDAVRRHLKGVNVRKASGLDGVSPHFLKQCADELTTSLVHIFRQCLVVQGVAVAVERGKSHTRPQEEAEVGAEQLPTHLTPLSSQ